MAQGGGQLYETHRLGNTRVSTKDGTRVTTATFRALAKRRLVHVNTSTTLFSGQDITVTAEGQLALVHHRPSAAPATAAVPVPTTALTSTARAR